MKQIFCIVFFSLLIFVQDARSEDGKIWYVAGQKFISENSLTKHLARSQNILLGLRMDNPDHHVKAAKIIGNLAKKGQKPVILLSYVERNKQNAFAIFTQRHKNSLHNNDATGLDMLLDWSSSGQSDWPIVRPVFDMAMLRKLPLKAINFSRYEIGELHRKDLGGLSDDVKSDLMPLIKIKTKIMQELGKAFCQDLPTEVLAKFAMIHRAQNGLFALAIAETGPEKAVLIAARKHVIKDTGVPYILGKLAGTDKSISLAFAEVGQDMQAENVDYIWYTKKIPPTKTCEN